MKGPHLLSNRGEYRNKGILYAWQSDTWGRQHTREVGIKSSFLKLGGQPFDKKVFLLSPKIRFYFSF